MQEKQVIFQTGGHGKVVRKIAVTIMGSLKNRELLKTIYQNVRNDIYMPALKSKEYEGEGNLKVVLDETSEGYQYILEVTKESHLHPHIAQWVHYTKSELEKCEYFQMNILSPLELEGTYAADYGTQYKGGCQNPECRLGGKPIGDVLVDRKFLNQKKWNIGTLCPDSYVSEQVKDLICSNGLTGVSFEHEVKDWKGREMPKFHVMEIENVLPPMSESAWLIESPHPDKRYEACGHQIVYLRSDAQYESEKLEDALDFNLSTEYVDNYRVQVIIVSARVRQIFKQNKVHAGFFPVTVRRQRTQGDDSSVLID